MDWAVNEWSVSGVPVLIVFDNVLTMVVTTPMTADVAASINVMVTVIDTSADVDTKAAFSSFVALAPDNALEAKSAIAAGTRTGGVIFNIGTCKKLEPIV